MSEPIMIFENEDELNKSLKEWKKRLFLNDWNIKAYLAHGEDIAGLAGESEAQWVNSCGVIRIRYGNEMPNDMIEKEPHEKILVHELLHFKMMSFTSSDMSIEDVFFDEKQHQLLEQIAKSIIMAKYNIKYNWFFN